MSKAKHTPWPWKDLGGGDIGAPFDATDDWVVAMACDGIPDGQYEANTRLIAAAPDLLEALEKLVSYDDMAEDDEGNLMVHYADMVNSARAAIAKARGES